MFRKMTRATEKKVEKKDKEIRPHHQMGIIPNAEERKRERTTLSTNTIHRVQLVVASDTGPFIVALYWETHVQ